MKRLLNTQYTQFVLDHVVRPYQGMLGYEQRIDRLMFVRTDEPGSINYADLIIYSNTRTEWFDLVIDRLARYYEAIDFSFFPKEAFAQVLQISLIANGVMPLAYYDNSIYANAEYPRGGVIPKIPPTAWEEVTECAKKVTNALRRLAEVTRDFKGPDFSQKK